MTVTPEKNKDTGFVILLGLIVWHLYSGNRLPLQAAVLCGIVALAIPVVLTPVSFVWYGVSEAAGGIISRVLLCVIFFCIVTPVGAARRLTGHKGLLMERWKKGRESVFGERNKRFGAADIENPF